MIFIVIEDYVLIESFSLDKENLKHYLKEYILIDLCNLDFVLESQILPSDFVVLESDYLSEIYYFILKEKIDLIN